MARVRAADAAARVREGVDADAAESMLGRLRAQLNTLTGQQFAGVEVSSADEFSYTDPVDGSVSHGQGLRVLFANGGRVVLRLSGTGTSGATLRVYYDQYVGPRGELEQDPQEALKPLIQAADELVGISASIGRTAPDVIT